MVLTDREKGELEAWYHKICQEMKIDSNLYDFFAKVDSNISRWENQNIILDDLNILKENGTLLLEQKKKADAEQEREIKENEIKQQIKLADLFKKPTIISIIADVNQGKSMAAYYLIDYLKKNFEFNLYTYGLRVDIGGQRINSVEEAESIRDGILIADEFFNLFNLEDRKQRHNIEKTMRLICHNNNILVLIGVPENYKKFISAKTEIAIFKRCTLNDFINGSRVKNIATNYKGMELGSSVLDIPIDKMLVFDGKHYDTLVVPYLKEFDTKSKNVPVLVPKNVQKKCSKKDSENVEVKDGTKL